MKLYVTVLRAAAVGLFFAMSTAFCATDTLPLHLIQRQPVRLISSLNVDTIGSDQAILSWQILQANQILDVDLSYVVTLREGHRRELPTLPYL